MNNTNEESMTDDFDANLETQEQEDQFIRGVMICQVWARTLRKDAGEIAQILSDNEGKLGREYAKLVCGEDHQFARAMIDHFDLPHQKSGDTIKLGRPYGPRYHKAWKELGVRPSDSERAAVSSAANFLKSIYDGTTDNDQ